MARAISGAPFSTARSRRKAGAALSALAAAGWELNRKGTLEKIREAAAASEQRIAAVYDLIVKARDLLRSSEHLSPAAGLSRQAYARVQDAYEAVQTAKYGLGGRTNVEGVIAALLSASQAKEQS